MAPLRKGVASRRSPGRVKAMWYDLWDAETGNQVGRYPTEGDALDAVRADLARYGKRHTDMLALTLLRHDPDWTDFAVIAEGAALLDRALDVSRVSERLTASTSRASGVL